MNKPPCPRYAKPAAVPAILAITLVTALSVAMAVEAPAQEQPTTPELSPAKTWPFQDLSQKDAWLAGLRARLYNDGVFHSLPEGISLYLDVDDEADRDGWCMVTVRQRNSEPSAGDPNVSPALVHFYVHETDGEIQWYDIANDQRRPYSEFLRIRQENQPTIQP